MGDRNNIGAVEHGRNGVRLNGRRVDVAHFLGDDLLDNGVQAGRVKLSLELAMSSELGSHAATYGTSWLDLVGTLDCHLK